MKILIVYNKVVMVDDEDYYRVKDRNWCLNKGKWNNSPYVMYGIRNGKRVRKVYLHRLIANAEKEDRVEFVSSNTLDCRKNNLRKNGNRI